MQKTSSGRLLKVLTISLLLVVCGYSLSFNILSNTMDPLIGEFSLTGASQGLMTSMISFGSMLPLFILPLLQGRVHKLWLILAASLLQVTMLLCTGLSVNFGMLLTVCVLLGAGNNFNDTCVNSYMVDLYPQDSARCLGLLHAFYGIGGLLTPLLISAVLNHSGWRASYYVAAAIFGVFSLFYLFVAVRAVKSGGEVQTAKETPFSMAMLRSFLRRPRNLYFMATAAFYAACQLGLVSWVVRYTSVCFNNAQIGSWCLTAYWVCATICRLVAPRLPFKPGRMLVIGAAGAGVFHALGVLSGSAAGMLVASALIGLISGHCIPVMLGESARGNEDKTSLVTSAMFLMMGLARMVMPLGMGAVGANSLPAAMLLPAGAALLCALFSWLASRSA